MEPDILDQFGVVIRGLRLEIGLSQESFALKVGIHRTYIGGIERGERNITLINILRISEALGVKPQVIFERMEQQRNE